VDGPPAQTNGLVWPHLVGTTIYKMTGSGNDFVMVDGRHTTPAEWSVDDIRAVCARGTGVGADGLVFVGPGSAPLGPDAVRMIYFNSDGSRAAMCGNAALCSTRLAVRLGLANPQHMTLETDAATYESCCTPDDERAEVHLAPVGTPAPVPGLTIAPGERKTVLGTVGVPHLVVLVGDVERVDVVTRGRLLRSLRRPGRPNGACGHTSAAWKTKRWRAGRAQWPPRARLPSGAWPSSRSRSGPGAAGSSRSGRAKSLRDCMTTCGWAGRRGSWYGV